MSRGRLRRTLERILSAVLIAAGVIGLPTLPDDVARWVPLLGDVAHGVSGFVSSPLGRFALVALGIWLFLESLTTTVRPWLTRSAPAERRDIGYTQPTPPPPVAEVPSGPRLPSSGGYPPTTPPAARVRTTITPAELAAYYDDRTMMEGDRLAKPHLNKWMTVGGVVREVTGHKVGEEWGFVMVHLIGEPGITLTFRRDRQEPASILRKGESITATGRLTEAKVFGISLDDCELVDQP